MGCAFSQNCGGCVFRDLSLSAYQHQKEQTVKRILDIALQGVDFIWRAPVFIPDGQRRRAAFAFCFQKGRVVLGFNTEKSHQIAPCEKCVALLDSINALLPALKTLLEALCLAPVYGRKNKALKPITSGDILVLAADNGIDVVLETEGAFDLPQREIVSDFMRQNENVLRFSLKRPKSDLVEPIVQKLVPQILIAGVSVDVAPAMFLQPSQAGEKVLVDLVKHYLNGVRGKIADLFCGIGTFSYPLLQNKPVKIVASDISAGSLQCFRQVLHRLMIPNVEIVQKNLFKYPFSADELKDFDAAVIDPPRAGALAQVQKIGLAAKGARFQKIVYVSCNPHSFVHDAKVLLASGYKLLEVTMVDQFVFTNHAELVAFFTDE